MLGRVSERRARAATPEPPDPDELRIISAEVHAGERLAMPALVDTALRDCDLANIRTRRASAWRVTVASCRLTGITLSTASLRDVAVISSQLDLAGFDAATLERVRFEDCVLRDASFLDARLHSVSFVDCDLSGADFTGVVASRVEMIGCRLDRLRGLPSLRGVQMRWTDVLENAGLFATALGIAILEEG